MSSYAFRDTIAATRPALGRSAESVQFNGIWLEDVVTGLRIMNVEGRELSAADITTYDAGNKTGEYFRSRRYNPREIIVTFQLIAASDAAFRTAFNTLNSYLRPEQAQLIFNDETDKYFIASASQVSEPEPGRNAVTGEIVFYCADPRKYAVTAKSFTAAANSDGILQATIVNAGTMPADIDYTITNNHDNGYIGIAGPTGAIQLGFPDEVDGETYTGNVQLLSIQNIFDDVANVDPASVANAMRSDFVNGGSMGKLDIGTASYLWMTSKPGTSGKWNGAQKTITLSSASENFYCYFRSWFQAANVNQIGLQTIAFLTDDDKVICGYSIFKTKQGNWNSTLQYWANGKVIKSISESAGASNNSFRTDTGGGHMDIRKEGAKITFHWRGTYPSYIVPEVENMACAKVQIGFYGWSNLSLGTYGLTRNYIKDFNYYKVTVDEWEDVPNRYAAGDVVEISGKNATVTVNGMLKTSDEVIGSEYFKAAPGNTPVLFTASEWAESGTLTAVATIREAWL